MKKAIPLSKSKTTLNQPAGKPIRYSLGTLLGFLALNAFGGGYYGLSGAEKVPTEWLQGTPFRTYFLPSLVLFVVVGGVALVAAIAVFRGNRWAQRTAYASGLLTLVWLAIQVAMIGYVSWMQPATAVAAVIILLLAWRLPQPESLNL